MTRLAVLASHPVQYYAPLFRTLARRLELHVFYAHRATPSEQARAGFGTAFEWDVDLFAGYDHSFLANIARQPGTDQFGGCDTPDIYRKLREVGADALLVMGWHLKSYVQGIVAAKRLGLPVLVRGDSQLATGRSVIKRSVKAMAYPRLLGMFDAVLPVGRRSREYYEHYRVPPEKMHFSPHCVDNDWFAARATDDARRHLRDELAIGSATPVALFAGKLIALKRPLDLVKAASRVRAQGCSIEILVAGDGELDGAMRDCGRSLVVPLHMLGFCNQTRMPSVYAAADCLVLPSDAETWGLVANEALACSRPIAVSAACGCAPDLATDERVGRVFAPGDIMAMASAMTALTVSPPDKRSIAEVSGKYSLQAATNGILAAVASVI
jgi:glycosyltransferase involved in cell wall biosynthesis